MLVSVISKKDFWLGLEMASYTVGMVKISLHYNDVIMSGMAFQITSLIIVYLTVSSGAAQRKHQSSASLAFVRAIHRRPVNSPHKGPVTRKMFPFDDGIMTQIQYLPGGRLNKKDGLTRYGDSHVKDKTS